jgi:hypothetical protein
MAALVIIASGELASLSHRLTAMGGHPEGAYPADMLPDACIHTYSAGLRSVDWKKDPVAAHLAGEIYSLRQKLADNVALVERVRAKSLNNWDRLVLEAFEHGEACYPPTFEYGTGAGNYRTDLVSDGKTLYRTRSVPGRDYGQRLEAIAIRGVA